VSHTYDAIVVGAGPAGSAAALALAQRGVLVALLERGEYAGSKNMFGGVIYGSVLDDVIPGWWEVAPLERYITRRVTAFMSEDSALCIDFKTSRFGKPPYNGWTVQRPHFDRWLAGQAEQAGAELITSTLVTGPLLRNGRVAGVEISRPGGLLEAPVVIAADGVNSLFAKAVGLQREFARHEVEIGVKETIELDRSVIEERFGLQGREGADWEMVGAASGAAIGGAFLYTNLSSISLGIVCSIESLAEARVRPEVLLANLRHHPAIAPLVRGGRIREYSAHLVPAAGRPMFPKRVGDGVVLVGDAAGLTLGVGIYLEGANFAIGSGLIAAEAVVDALNRGDTSASGLADYEMRLRESFVLKDFDTYKHAQPFIANRRVQNVYPRVLADIAEQVFRVDNRKPKRRLGHVLWGPLRAHGVSPLQVVRDLWRAGRAYF